MSKQIRLVKVPTGNHFMNGTSINFLRKTCKTELNAKAKIRLKAAILRKQDMTYSQICTSLDILPSTLSYWLNRMNIEGVTASHHRVHLVYVSSTSDVFCHLKKHVQSSYPPRLKTRKKYRKHSHSLIAFHLSTNISLHDTLSNRVFSIIVS